MSGSCSDGVSQSAFDIHWPARDFSDAHETPRAKDRLQDQAELLLVRPSPASVSRKDAIAIGRSREAERSHVHVRVNHIPFPVNFTAHGIRLVDGGTLECTESLGQAASFFQYNKLIPSVQAFIVNGRHIAGKEYLDGIHLVATRVLHDTL